MLNRYYPDMCRWMLLSGALFAASCTKENPAAKCSTGTCTDPAAPFCDVDGSVGGAPGSCLAVACMPGDFKACRGDVALTCNSMGNNYDELQCQKGCTPEAMGCKLCDAGQTVCTNGEVQMCDANGAVTSSEACPLGCFADQPRCRDVDASNGLSMYLDMVASPPDIDISDGNFDPATGQVTNGNTPVDVPSFLVSAPSNGNAIRVFVVNTAHLAGTTTARSPSVDPRNATGPAIAIVARGDLTISGTFQVQTTAGGYIASGCTGGTGHYTDHTGSITSSGGGGGAHGTDGARGGNVTSAEAGGAKGTASGTASLIPLRGGCPGGTSADSSGNYQPYGGPGGGAVQLTSQTSIVVDGTVDVRGSIGGADFIQGTSGGTSQVIFGGGAGGGILLEAPTVTLGPTAQLLASGGAGGAGCTTMSASCGLGGAGATAGVAAGAGADIAGAAVYSNTAGGGGGGLGRIRINTADQTYTKSNSTVEDGALTVGMVATR